MSKKNTKIINKIIDAILKHYNWTLHNDNGIYFLQNKNNEKVHFWHNDLMHTFALDIKDFYYELKMAKYINDGCNSYINPYIGLSDHEILIKCDLEKQF